MASSSSSSSSGGAKKDGEWKYKLYFDEEVDNVRGKSYEITADELIEKLTGLVNVDERIERVTIYKLPLTWWQLTKILFYHNFVLFKTKKWKWTIEKNSEGITIQRSKNKGAVKYHYRRKRRLPRIEKIIKDYGRRSVGDLIRWLYQKDELNKEYHRYFSNCKHFAKAVFNYVAKSKTY